MNLGEFDACLRGYVRANGGQEAAREAEYDEYLAALQEEHLRGGA
jgi:hypothetical protein